MEEIQLSRKSQVLLSGEMDYSKFIPDINTIRTFSDFVGVRTEKRAGEILRERVYIIVSQIIRQQKWKTISAIRVICYDCDSTEDLMQLDYNWEHFNFCPYCGSDNTVIEDIPAFTSERDFYTWATKELGVVKRSIDLRKEYLDRMERMGISYEDAFAGLVKHGVNWLRLARKLEQATANEGNDAVGIEEAQYILTSYENENFDASAIKRLTDELSDRDDIELVAIPNTSDFIMQAISPRGRVKWRIYFMGVLVDSDSVVLDSDKLWNTTIGNMVARRLKILTDITYSYGLGIINDNDFYELWEKRAAFVAPLRLLIMKLVGDTRHYIDAISEDTFIDNTELKKLGTLQLLRTIYSYIRPALPTTTESVKNIINELDNALEIEDK